MWKQLKLITTESNLNLNYGDGISLIIITSLSWGLLHSPSFVFYLTLMEIVIFITLFAPAITGWSCSAFRLCNFVRRTFLVRDFLAKLFKFSSRVLSPHQLDFEWQKISQNFGYRSIPEKWKKNRNPIITVSSEWMLAGWCIRHNRVNSFSSSISLLFFSAVSSVSVWMTMLKI